MLRGPESKCEKIKAALLLPVQVAEAIETTTGLRRHRETVQVDPRFYPFLVGRFGIFIRKFCIKHNVYVRIPDKGNEEEEIIIGGYECNVKTAKKALLKLVEEIDTLVTEEVKSDPYVYGGIIGHKGKDISSLQEQFSVKVQFPQPGRQTDLVKILGKKENAQKQRVNSCTWRKV